MSTPKLKKLKKLTPQEEKKDDTIRILYVEDTEVIRDTISSLLEANGYKVALAKNGQEGLEMVAQWKPHVVLMDLRMPGMDGYQAVEALKTNLETKHIPVIVISAWSGKSERTRAKLAGANEFFAKPPDLGKLINTIEKLIADSPYY